MLDAAVSRQLTFHGHLSWAPCRVRHMSWPTHASSGSQVDELVASTVATHGGVDILVANAGIVRAAEFLEMSEQDFDDVIRVNLKGTFLVRHSLPASLRAPNTVQTPDATRPPVRAQTGQAVGRQMAEQNKAAPGRGGAIVNMSSVNAVMAIPTVAGYNSSKGGVANLTRCGSVAHGPFLYALPLTSA